MKSVFRKENESFYQYINPNTRRYHVNKLFNNMIDYCIINRLQDDSGKYLIKDIGWSLTQQECKTNITVIKDSLMNQIETAVMELPRRIEEQE